MLEGEERVHIAVYLAVDAADGLRETRPATLRELAVEDERAAARVGGLRQLVGRSTERRAETYSMCVYES